MVHSVINKDYLEIWKALIAGYKPILEK